MANDTIIKTKVSDNRETRLIALPPDWSPWKFQVDHFDLDGKAYQRPGERVCTGWASFETKAEAVACFERSI